MLFCFHFVKLIEANSKFLSLILLLQNKAHPYLSAFGEKNASAFEIVHFRLTVL